MASRADASSEGSRRGRPDPVLTLGLWPPPQAAWLPASALALIFLGHLLYAATVNSIALALQIPAALLLGAALLNRRLRTELARLRDLKVPAILFCLTILVALWTLTPWTPGGPHPVWAFVGVGPAASTIDKSTVTVEIVKLLGLASVFALGLLSGSDDRRARFALRAAIWASAVFGLWAFADFVTGAPGAAASRRLQAHFLSPNTAGLFFGVALALALAELASVLRRSRPGGALEALPLAAAALVLAICLLSTASRSAISGALAAGGLYILLQIWTGRMKLGRGALVAGLGVLLGLALGAYAGGELIDRLMHADPTDLNRLTVWRLHWGAFLESPLFGYGLGVENTVNRTLLTLSNFNALWSVNHPHNVYLQWLEDSGVVGATPMFAAIGWLIWSTARGYARRSRMTAVLAGLLGADLVVLVNGATDFGLSAYSIAAAWAWLLGLQFAIAQGTSQR